jgi:hypothetical protein
MKQFKPLAFDPWWCAREVGQLQKFLARHKNLKEAEQIQPFFQKRSHLSAFLASYSPDVVHFDRLAFQYPSSVTSPVTWRSEIL